MKQHYSLHDCRADCVALSGSTLSFYFPQGVFLLPAEGGEAQQSEAAWLDIPILDSEISVSVYRPHRGHVLREEWETENFINAVNDGSFQVEFLTEYCAYRSLLYKCTLWFDAAPYHWDCDIELESFGAHLRFT